jgi:hypothetical protein
LVAGLTAGGIAAVVVAGAIVAGISVGAGGYAVAQQIADGDDVGMNANPLFEAQGKAGFNPTFGEGAA